MKYKIMVYWTSGEIEVINCETLKLAEICIDALRERTDIYIVGLLDFENGKSKIN